MRKLFVYIVIDLQRLGKVADTPQAYGSLKELVTANIEDKGKVLNYMALWSRLSENSDIHYWKNERFIISKVEVKRSRKINIKK